MKLNRLLKRLNEYFTHKTNQKKTFTQDDIRLYVTPKGNLIAAIGNTGRTLTGISENFCKTEKI